jgi:hypothetical protein
VAYQSGVENVKISYGENMALGSAMSASAAAWKNMVPLRGNAIKRCSTSQHAAAAGEKQSENGDGAKIAGVAKTSKGSLKNARQALGNIEESKMARRDINERNGGEESYQRPKIK